MEIKLTKSYSCVMNVLITSKNLRSKMKDVEEKIANNAIPESLRSSVSSLLRFWKSNLIYRKNSALQFLLTVDGALPNKRIDLRKSITSHDLELLRETTDRELKVTMNPHKTFTIRVWKLY